MRLTITLALLWIPLGCTTVPRAVVQVARAVDPVIAASPTTSAEIEVEARFAEARSALDLLDPCCVGFWPIAPALTGVYTGKLSRADFGKAREGWLARERHPATARLTNDGRPTHLSAQYAYISDVRITMNGADPVIGTFTTGAAITATAVARSGAGASIDAEVEVAWLYEPLGTTSIRIADPACSVAIDVPAVLRKQFPVHFDLAPGEVGVVLIERSGHDARGRALLPGVLALTARPRGS